MAAAARFSMVEEAKKLKLVAVVSGDNATGFVGVQEHDDGKFFARFRDAQRKKNRALPGRYATAEDAALARAYALRMQESLEEGESLPSPAKRKKRSCAATSTPSMPVVMTSPMTATTGVPFAPLQPLESSMPVAMAVPMATVAMGAGYTAPQPWEVTRPA